MLNCKHSHHLWAPRLTIDPRECFYTAGTRDSQLDAESSTATLGKTAGKDAANDKPTYVSLLGLSRAREFAGELHADALAALSDFGPGADRLRQLADYIVLRKY